MLCRLMKQVCNLQDHLGPFLCTPHTLACFHLDDVHPLSMEVWKIAANIWPISVAFSLRNHGGISSGPLALFGFKDCNCLMTPGIVIIMVPMLGFGSGPTGGILLGLSSVNTLENCSRVPTSNSRHL